MEEVLLPLEQDPAAFGQGENIREDLLPGLGEQARARGLWSPQMPRERGGQGLGPVGMAVVYEELGRARFGPVACHCVAPDDGNMLVLEKVGTAEQKERWLQPIVDGRVRSAIVMTEPAPGSGSDPAGMMLTRAERRATATSCRAANGSSPGPRVRPTSSCWRAPPTTPGAA